MGPRKAPYTKLARAAHCDLKIKVTRCTLKRHCNGRRCRNIHACKISNCYRKYCIWECNGCMWSCNSFHSLKDYETNKNDNHARKQPKQAPDVETFKNIAHAERHDNVKKIARAKQRKTVYAMHLTVKRAQGDLLKPNSRYQMIYSTSKLRWLLGSNPVGTTTLCFSKYGNLNRNLERAVKETGRVYLMWVPPGSTSSCIFNGCKSMLMNEVLLDAIPFICTNRIVRRV
ncbi:hypothetical protein LguiA_025973 [Lonicera macranthoides]